MHKDERPNIIIIIADDIVRQGKWKLVARHRGEWELYDLEADRTEMNSLAKEQQKRVREMVKKYEAWAKRRGVVAWERLPRRRR